MKYNIPCDLAWFWIFRPEIELRKFRFIEDATNSTIGYLCEYLTILLSKTMNK